MDKEDVTDEFCTLIVTESHDGKYAETKIAKQKSDNEPLNAFTNPD